MSSQSYYLTGFINRATEENVKNARYFIGKKHGSDAISVTEDENNIITINFLSLKPRQYGQFEWKGSIET